MMVESVKFCRRTKPIYIYRFIQVIYLSVLDAAVNNECLHDHLSVSV